MAKEQYTYLTRYIAATPRNKRLTDSIQAAAQSGGSSVISSGGTQYWQLVTTDADGNDLEESAYYLTPVSGQHLRMPGDVVAYATDDEADLGLPVASDYDTTGLFRAKEGGGLLYNSTTGAWYVDPEFQGGLNTTQLEQYLTQYQYVTQTWIIENGYIKLNSQLTGYTKPDTYTSITETDTLLSALGKLEANFGNYVDLTTDQTVGGVKTFSERVLSQKDVVAYATDDEADLGLPVASDYDTTGLFRAKEGGGLLYDSTENAWYVDPEFQGSGVNFTVGTALELTSSGVLNVKLGTTSSTACAGNDSRLSDNRSNPYALSWSGYSSGSYDGSSTASISIPNNTNQLTNGAGYITGITQAMVLNVMSGTKSSGYFLNGSGTFSQITTSDISGLSTGYVTINTAQTITAQKTYSALGWYNGVGLLKAGASGNVHIIFGAGSGNVINGVTSDESMGNLYFNYNSSSAYTRVDSSNNLLTTGNLVTYGTLTAGSSNNVHILVGGGSGNVINGLTSSEAIGNLYFNYNSSSAFTRVDGSNNFQTAGDVVAYSTSSSLSDFVPVATTSTYGIVTYDGTTIGKNSSGQLCVLNGGAVSQVNSYTSGCVIRCGLVSIGSTTIASNSQANGGTTYISNVIAITCAPYTTSGGDDYKITAHVRLVSTGTYQFQARNNTSSSVTTSSGFGIQYIAICSS